MTKLDIAKRIIKENYKDADCGIYDTRNIVGDPMTTIYRGNELTIDICYHYSYFENPQLCYFYILLLNLI